MQIGEKIQYIPHGNTIPTDNQWVTTKGARKGARISIFAPKLYQIATLLLSSLCWRFRCKVS